MLERRRGCLGLRKKVVVAHLGTELKGGLCVVKLGVRCLDAGDVILRLGETRHGLTGGIGVVPKTRLGAAPLKIRDKRPALVHVQIALDLGEPVSELAEALLSHLGHYRFLPWQFLNFLPLPQGQGSLRPTPT